jgi:protein required for attachment to host cells
MATGFTTEAAMQPTWILVADGVRARLFAPSPDGGSLIELEDFTHPAGRTPGRHAMRDRPPRTMESANPAHHAIEPRTTEAEKVANHFARELNQVLERGRVDHRYERLVLAAPPDFLGTLLGALDHHVRDCVVGRVDKDLTTLPVEEIHARLTTVVH